MNIGMHIIFYSPDPIQILNKIFEMCLHLEGCPVNAVGYGGYCYATMDYSECAPSGEFGSCPKNCQDQPMKLPPQWELAPYSEGVVREVVAKYPFSTLCVVFSNGNAYGTKSYHPAGKLCLHGMLVASGSSYKAKLCEMKVLIRIIQGK